MEEAALVLGLANQLCRTDIVVLDEIGSLPFSRVSAQLLFHLLLTAC